MKKVFLVILLSPMLLWARPKPRFPLASAVPPNVRVTVDGMSGTGCPQGTASVALSPDSSVLSVLFDQFYTEINPGDAQTAVRKTCMIRLRVWFSGKYRVALVGSDIRAFAAVPAGARSTIDIQHYSPFAHGNQWWKKMNLNRVITGPFQEDVFLQSDFSDKPLWSHCGSQLGGQGFPLMSINMTIDSSNNTNDSLVTTIDSADINATAGLKYHLLWKPDNKNCP